MPLAAGLGTCRNCLASSLIAEIDGTESVDEDRADSPCPEVPGFRLRSKLGEGGSGVVWLAEEVAPPRRLVALKILKPGLEGGESQVRFEAEASALAMMDDPRIARVYHAGELPDGRPYFAMEPVDGEPINEFCRRQRTSLSGRIQLVREVCLAVAHAHERGIIHRDLKPSNILVASSGAPRVIDFGVARATESLLTDRTLVTRDGQAIGTPAYMSPEQAAMRGEQLDVRSDIYSLGVVLYELLTGSTPIDRETLDTAPYDEVLREIRAGRISPPSRKVTTLRAEEIEQAGMVIDKKQLRRDLRGADGAVLRALEKDPGDRFQSALEFAESLNGMLDGERSAGQPSKKIKGSRSWAKGGARRWLLPVTWVGVLAGIAALLAFQPFASQDGLPPDREAGSSPGSTDVDARGDHVPAPTLELAEESLLRSPDRPESWLDYSQHLLARYLKFEGVICLAEAARLRHVAGDYRGAEEADRLLIKARQSIPGWLVDGVHVSLAGNYPDATSPRRPDAAADILEALAARREEGMSALETCRVAFERHPWDVVRLARLGRAALESARAGEPASGTERNALVLAYLKTLLVSEPYHELCEAAVAEALALEVPLDLFGRENDVSFSKIEAFDAELAMDALGLSGLGRDWFLVHCARRFAMGSIQPGHLERLQAPLATRVDFLFADRNYEAVALETELALEGEKRPGLYARRHLLDLRFQTLVALDRREEAQAIFLEAKEIIARDPHTPGECLDLTDFYNASHQESWILKERGVEGAMEGLREGVASFRDGVLFDVRGVIQLFSLGMEEDTAAVQPGSPYPRSVTDIPVGRKFTRLHVLQSAVWDPFDESQVAAFLIRYADGSKVKWPIRSGVEVADLFQTSEGLRRVRVAGLKPAWRGRNRSASHQESELVLFQAAWHNPHPDRVVESIDLVAAGGQAGLCVFGITLEP